MSDHIPVNSQESAFVQSLNRMDDTLDRITESTFNLLNAVDTYVNGLPSDDSNSAGAENTTSSSANVVGGESTALVNNEVTLSEGTGNNDEATPAIPPANSSPSEGRSMLTDTEAVNRELRQIRERISNLAGIVGTRHTFETDVTGFWTVMRIMREFFESLHQIRRDVNRLELLSGSGIFSFGMELGDMPSDVSSNGEEAPLAESEDLADDEKNSPLLNMECHDSEEEDKDAWTTNLMCPVCRSPAEELCTHMHAWNCGHLCCHNCSNRLIDTSPHNIKCPVCRKEVKYSVRLYPSSV